MCRQLLLKIQTLDLKCMLNKTTEGTGSQSSLGALSALCRLFIKTGQSFAADWQKDAGSGPLVSEEGRDI